MIPRRWTAGFDSATGLLRAQSLFLRGRSFPNLAQAGRPAQPFLSGIAQSLNRLPYRIRQGLISIGGSGEAVSAERVGDVDIEQLSEWAVRHYPHRRYPAVMVGSANGAAVHLGAALTIPWLPQTFLLPVRNPSPHVHEPQLEMEWGIGPGRRLLAANPGIQLHHMLDPVQDLLMSKVFSYFRIKKLVLGRAYERFIEECLEPGGAIILVECEQKWPTTMVAERHFFQFGGMGGATLADYFQGSERVAAYLSQIGADRTRWHPPEPDGYRPEAEWGFEPALRHDVERFAKKMGAKVHRLSFENPSELSPMVSDLHRWWHLKRGMFSNRLIVESFVLVEPFWTLRVGAAPFWLTFPTQPYDRMLEQYLLATPPFDEIGLMLFAHGVKSIGLPSMERWREIAGFAGNRGVFLGVDEKAFPADLAMPFRYHSAIGREFAARYPIPGPLTLADVAMFVSLNRGRYEVAWEEDRGHPELPGALAA